MKAWNEIKHYAGFDWAKDHHDVIVLDGGGKIVADFRFDHTAGGWNEFGKKLAAFPGVAVAIETNHGGVIERLLELECCIFPVHTRSAKGYRQRKVPSGNKTDQMDAWSLADALRLDGAHWKQLSPQDPLIKELRLLCRDEVALIRDRSALITQLRQALYDYYPAALEAFDDWTTLSSLGFYYHVSNAGTSGQSGQTQMGEVLACSQAGSACHLSTTAGDIRPRGPVRRFRADDARQI